MFVPDLLHEVELGGWKSLFIHLIRILQAEGEHLVDELDARYVSKYIFLGAVLNGIQVPQGPNVRTEYYSSVSRECLRNEENGRAGL